jgi:hypothetical protein
MDDKSIVNRSCTGSCSREYVCIVSKFLPTQCTKNFTYPHTYIYLSTHIYSLIHTYIHLSTHIYSFIHTHIFTYPHIYSFIHTHIFTYPQIYSLIHTHIFTYPQTYIHLSTHIYLLLLTYIPLSTHIFPYPHIYWNIHVDQWKVLCNLLLTELFMYIYHREKV